MTTNSNSLMGVCSFKLPYYLKIHRTIMEILSKKMITIIYKCQKRYIEATGVTTKFYKCIAVLNYELNNNNKTCEWQ